MYETNGKEMVPPRYASDVKEMLAEIMAEIRAGKMDPKLMADLDLSAAALLAKRWTEPQPAGT